MILTHIHGEAGENVMILKINLVIMRNIKIVFLFFFVIIVNEVISQPFSSSSNKVKKIIYYIKSADSLLYKNNFYKAGILYDSAYEVMGKANLFYDQFKVVKVWLQSNEVEKTIKHLKLIPKSAYYSISDKIIICKHLMLDSFFMSLHNYTAYRKVIQKLNKIEKIYSVSFDKNLSHSLDSILYVDQFERMKVDSIKNIYGKESKELMELWNKINYNDSTNILFVTNILKAKGWVGENVVGRGGGECSLFYNPACRFRCTKKIFSFT